MSFRVAARTISALSSTLQHTLDLNHPKPSRARGRTEREAVAGPTPLRACRAHLVRAGHEKVQKARPGSRGCRAYRRERRHRRYRSSACGAPVGTAFLAFLAFRGVFLRKHFSSSS